MSSLVPVNCGICGATESRRLHRIRGLQIVQCKECGCIYTNPRHVWDYSQSNTSFQEKLATYQTYYWPKREVSANNFWNRAAAYYKIGTLLEIGCGFGFFLNEAQHRGWSVIGVEVSRDEARWGQEQFGLTIVGSLNHELLLTRLFDAVILWDVIEHIPDVRSLLCDCFALLRPGGLLFLKTPDGEGLTMQAPWWSLGYMKLYWQLVYPANPIEHPYHFTLPVLSKVLGESGFRISSVETEQDWEERILVGRNLLVGVLRRFLMWIAWKARLPYEMVVWAEKKQQGDTLV